ncbi:MAG: hydrogenase maturation nickel metallochaperone HypA [Chitinispirillaceae bacterium]|nr:hydrogenase maturation nickel metallochaperone HypA [Chitinispirillaceae bacterium]
MHEMSIAEGMIDIINETARKHGLSRVEKVRLRIGAMRQIVPDALRFAFEVLGKETIAHGAEIVITDVPVKASCGDCGCEFRVEDRCFICASCGSGSVVVTAGKELYIDSIEGE